VRDIDEGGPKSVSDNVIVTTYSKSEGKRALEKKIKNTNKCEDVTQKN